MSDSSRYSRGPFRGWSKENLTPKEFVRKHTLPQVAKIFESGADDLKSPAQLDLRQPFLLYQAYSSVKVHARSLQRDARGSYAEVGPTVVIPEDYTGWFSIVTESHGKLHSAQYYSTVEQVATSQVPFFLVRNDTPAYKLNDLRASGGKLLYVKTTVKTGHVLKLLGVFEDLNQYRHQKFVMRHMGSNPSVFKYAQCLNYKGEVLFLPFTAKGMFYATATKATRSSTHVYLMSHLLKFIKFPISVRLVCGFLPKVPCNFTGVLRLQCAKREDIILACTLFKERNVMLEMDMNSGFTLSKVTEEDKVTRHEVYQSAVAFCADEAEIWRRQMKVMHYVYPETLRIKKVSRKTSGNSSGSGHHRDMGSGSNSSSMDKKHLIDRMDTQSVCISMIFDDLDVDDDDDHTVEVSPKVYIHRRSEVPVPAPVNSRRMANYFGKSSVNGSQNHGGLMRRLGFTGSRSSSSNTSSGNQIGNTHLLPPLPLKQATEIESDSALQRKATKFWTLRKLKKLVQASNSDSSNAGSGKYAVIRPRRTVNDLVNDGSENANDEFMTRLTKDVGKTYVKIPGFELPENGTYVMSRTKYQYNKCKPGKATVTSGSTPAQPIYDSVC